MVAKKMKPGSTEDVVLPDVVEHPVEMPLAAAGSTEAVVLPDVVDDASRPDRQAGVGVLHVQGLFSRLSCVP